MCFIILNETIFLESTCVQMISDTGVVGYIRLSIGEIGHPPKQSLE